jgi:hypothetical protein
MTNESNGTLRTRRPIVASLLIAQFRLSGYRPGLPRGVTRQTVQADTEACRCLRCPVCGRRGMALIPWTDKPRQGYRILAACSRSACVGGVEL